MKLSFKFSYWNPDNIVKKIPSPYSDGILVCDSMEELAEECLPNGISISIYSNNGYRKSSNVIECGWLAYDIDNGTPHKDICHILDAKGLNYMVLASMNHMKSKGPNDGEKERYHIFMPLSDTVQDNGLYHTIFTEFAERTFGKIFDRGVKDICRFYAPHSDILAISSHNKDLDTQYYEVAYKRSVSLEKRLNVAKEHKYKIQATKYGAMNVDRLQKSAWFIDACKGLSDIGDRYHTMQRIVGFMKKASMSKSDAVHIINKHAPQIEGRDWTTLTEKFYDWCR